MKRKIAMLILMVKREMFPASDDSKSGFRKFERWCLFNAPIIGIWLLLVLITLCGLLFLEFRQRVKHELNEFETSPINGLFATVRVGIIVKKPGEKQDIGNFDLQKWVELTIDDIPFKHLPASLRRKGLKTFDSIKPFSQIYLDIEDNNHEELLYREVMGLLLPNDPMLRNVQNDEWREKLIDMPLLQKVQEQLLAGYSSEKAFDGILASVEGMKKLGWPPDQAYPNTLMVKFSTDSEKNQKKAIPLRLAVVKKLPYVHYMVSMHQLRHLQHGYYYQKMANVDIAFEHEPRPEECKTIGKDLLPVSETTISPIIVGGKPTIRIELPEPLSPVEIFERFSSKKYYFSEMSFRIATNHDQQGGQFNENNYVDVYTGAIFHLNFKLPYHFLWHSESLDTIQQYFSEHQIEVVGEFVELYAEMLKSQQNLKEIQYIFTVAIILIVFILPLIFWVVIQTRMFRIGVKRMIGYPDNVIIAAYAILGFILVASAFIIPVMPMAFSLNWGGVGLLGIGMLILTEIGILLPVCYYLYLFQPAEMLSFQF